MSNEAVTLFNYKEKDILIREHKGKYQLGFRGANGVDIWLEQAVYNDIKVAITSGRDYLRIIIDRIILDEKRRNLYE